MKMAFWNNGSPRTVRVGGLDKTSGRFIGNRADPSIDLYYYVEDFIRPSEFEVAGSMSFSLDGDTITASRGVAAKSAEYIVAIMKRKVKALRDQTIAGPIEWSPDGGVTTYVVQTDEYSRNMLAGAVMRLDKKGNPNAAQGWRMQDNSFAALTKTDFDAMAVAIGDHVDACYTNQGVLEATIDAAPDPTLVDIEAGWPAIAEVTA